MAEEKEKLLRLVNSSGFPFQLRVADQIRRRADADDFFPWASVEQEYPWRAVEEGRDGFIDIIFRNSENDRMVVECKRNRDADWIFLLPKTADSSQGTRARMLYVNASSERPKDPLRIGWHDFYVEPDSTISEFCVVRGTGENQKPMLENLCGTLLISTECLAQEESAFFLERNSEFHCLYIPVIVTNANLRVCRFELDSVSLEDGEIPDGEFESVPFIRFSKSLSTKPISFAPSLNAYNRERQRTVFVVQSTQLLGFLEAWRMTATRENQRPWM